MSRTAPPPRNEPIPTIGRILWTVGPPVIRVVGRVAFSLQIERVAPPPAPPYVVAANHYSQFDPAVVGASFGDPLRYLALDELAEASRFLAWVLPTFGTITLSRRKLPIGSLRVALARLEAGEIVGTFPEGFRVARWGDRPPKRGAAWLASRAGVPLVPVAVIGTGRVFGLDNRLHRGKIRVVIGPAISPDGEDPTTLTSRWADWVGAQIRAHPGSQVDPHRPGRAG